MALSPPADAARQRAAFRHAAPGAAALARSHERDRCRRRRMPAVDARTHALQRGPCRRCRWIRDSFAVLSIPAQRRSATPRGGPRTQSARSRIAGSGDGSRGASTTRSGHEACRDCSEALALGRIYERAAADDRVNARQRALDAGRRMLSTRGSESRSVEVRSEALYRLALWHRRERRFGGSGGHLA